MLINTENFLEIRVDSEKMRKLLTMGKEVIIEVSFDYRNHLGNVKNYTVEFPSIHQLRNYFRWEPLIAMALKYGPVDRERLATTRSTNVRLAIWFQGERIEFQDAIDLGRRLRKNTKLYKALL